MKKPSMLACAGALLLAATVACVNAEQPDVVADAEPVAAVEPEASAPEQATPAAPAQAAPPARAKFVPPIRGQAELGFTRPQTKRVGNEVVTTMKVKNMSATGTIAGLKVDENWYDKEGNPVTGDTFRYRKPLMPGEVIEITLRTPVNAKMDRNQYSFTHANGTVKTVAVPKL